MTGSISLLVRPVRALFALRVLFASLSLRTTFCYQNEWTSFPQDITRKRYRMEYNITWIDKGDVRVPLYFSASRFLCNSGMILAFLFIYLLCGIRLGRRGGLGGLGFHSRRACFGPRLQSDFLLGSWNFVKIDRGCNRECWRGGPSLSFVFLCLVSPSAFWAHRSGLLTFTFGGPFFIVAPFTIVFDVPHRPFFRGSQLFAWRGDIGLVFRLCMFSLFLLLRDFLGDLLFDIPERIID